MASRMQVRRTKVAGPVRRWLSQHHWHHPRGAPTGDGSPPAPVVPGLRRRRDRDLPAAARMLRVVFAEGQYPVRFPDAPRAWLADSTVLDAWVVERRNELLGHVAIARVGNDPVGALRWRELTGLEPDQLVGVTRLYVRPSARSRGIGTALLDTAVAEIRSRGLAPVLEAVSASSDAIGVFEHRDWRLLGAFPWGDPDEKLRIRYYVAPPGG